MNHLEIKMWTFCINYRFVTSALSLPFSSSDAERAIYFLNIILTKTRSNLIPKTIDNLLTIMLNGPDIEVFQPQRITDKYLGKGYKNCDINSPTKIEQNESKMGKKTNRKQLESPYKPYLCS